MNTFAIVARDDFESEAIQNYFKQVLESNGMNYSETPELVIAIGGDGTMLGAFHQYGTTPHYVGIHTGTLGFYADWQKEEQEQLLQAILSNKTPEVSEYPLAEFELLLANGEKEQHFALNEAVIKSDSLSTFILEVYLNGHHFETFRGDGLIISTPSGSTAYNYSVQGSVLHPSFEAIQIAELAAINNGVFRTLNRSFILPKHHEVELYLQNKDKNALIGIDILEKRLSGIRKITARVSNEKIKFVRYKPFPFWQRVTDRFLG